MRGGTFALGCALIMAQSQAQSQGHPPAGLSALPPGPSQLLAKIEAVGPERAIAQWSKDGTFDRVLEGMETGRPEWLRLGVSLHGGTDAGYSEMLTLAAGVALEREPKAALSIWGVHDGVAGMCGYPDLSDPKTNTPQKAAAYIDARVRAVAGIRSALAKECLSVLKRTRKEIVSNNGPFR